MSTATLPEKTSSASPQAESARLVFLDGLRAIAALWVVVSHLWISQFGIAAHLGAFGLWTNWLIYSHLSVDAFIVLSGFCLILPVMKNGGLKGGVWTFFVRRARRILPPCYLALGLSMLLALVFEHTNHGHWHLDHWAVLANLLLLQDIFLKWNTFNSPLWSVAVEWRIYFLFPLLVWGLKKWGHLAVLITTAMLGYSVTALIFWKFPEIHMASPWYLLLFAMGICAGSIAFGSSTRHVSRRVWYGLSTLFLITSSLLLLAYPVTLHEGVTFGNHMPLIDAAVGAMISFFLIALSHDQSSRRQTKTLRILSWAPLVAVGQFSYSLYLTHMPLLIIFSHLLGLREIHNVPLQNFGLLITFGLPTMLGFAYLFFLVSERRFLKAKPA